MKTGPREMTFIFEPRLEAKTTGNSSPLDLWTLRMRTTLEASGEGWGPPPESAILLAEFFDEAEEARWRPCLRKAWRSGGRGWLEPPWRLAMPLGRLHRGTGEVGEDVGLGVDVGEGFRGGGWCGRRLRPVGEFSEKPLARREDNSSVGVIGDEFCDGMGEGDFAFFVGRGQGCGRGRRG